MFVAHNLIVFLNAALHCFLTAVRETNFATFRTFILYLAYFDFALSYIETKNQDVSELHGHVQISFHELWRAFEKKIINVLRKIKDK